jgi:hypothetical protein
MEHHYQFVKVLIDAGADVVSYYRVISYFNPIFLSTFFFPILILILSIFSLFRAPLINFYDARTNPFLIHYYP